MSTTGAERRDTAGSGQALSALYLTLLFTVASLVERDGVPAVAALALARHRGVLLDPPSVPRPPRPVRDGSEPADAEARIPGTQRSSWPRWRSWTAASRCIIGSLDR